MPEPERVTEAVPDEPEPPGEPVFPKDLAPPPEEPPSSRAIGIAAREGPPLRDVRLGRSLRPRAPAPAAAPAPPPPARSARPPEPPPPRPPERVEARVVDWSPPRYPPTARELAIEGVVRIEVEVRADGTLGAVEVVESSGSPLLDRAAVAAVRTWTFAPARLGDRPLASRVRLPPIRFRLE